MGLRPLVSARFQVLFTPLLGVLFTFPSRYWFTIGLSVVFSLGGWSPHFQTEFHVFRLTRFTNFRLSYTGLSPPLVGLSRAILLVSSSLLGLSLFARRYSGNLVDIFSSGYLDVSVPRVYANATGLQPARLPHSDIYGS